MAFGKNHAELVGRLGDDVTVNHLASGGRVANPPVAIRHWWTGMDRT